MGTVPMGLSQHQPLQPADWSQLEHRTDLAEAGDFAGAQRVLRFVQVSDAHILDDDAPSPMRVEFLDPLGSPFESASRPQEEFTDEVLAAMIRSINAEHAGDALDFVVNTGDNIDNELENELMRFLDIWEGTHSTTGPVSGLPCVPDGQSADWKDPSSDVTTQCTSLPESLAANLVALAPGLPWFSAFGNHDGLIQGNVPIEPSFQEAAGQFGRHFLTQPEYVGMHFEAGGSCVAGAPAGSALDDNGHGYGFAGNRLCDEDPDNDGYYAFGLRGVQFIVLDTVNDDFVTGNEFLAGQFNPQTLVGNDLLGGYSEGSVDPVQFNWLMDEISANQDRLVVVMSHHTVNSMFSSRTEGNCSGDQCLDDLLTEAGYKTGPEITEALAEHPNVVGWLGGHTHQHRIQPKTVAGAAGPGFWNVETSSLIDMPQEARVVELWVTADGAKGFWALQSIGHDYEPSRALALTDDQADPNAYGSATDQNVLLWFDIPTGVALVPQPSLERVLRMDLVSPTPLNGTYGRPGETLTLTLEFTDPLLNVTVPGLMGNISIDHIDLDTGASVEDLDAVALVEEGNGRYSVPFVASEGSTHYLNVLMTDPAGTFEDLHRTLSIRIESEATVAKETKESPGMETVAVLALLGSLAVLVRRKRS